MQPPARAEMMYDATVVGARSGARITVAPVTEPARRRGRRWPRRARAARRLPARGRRRGALRWRPVAPRRRLWRSRLASPDADAAPARPPRPLPGRGRAQGEDAEFGYWPLDDGARRGWPPPPSRSRTAASAATPASTPWPSAARLRPEPALTAGASRAPRPWPCRWRACSTRARAPTRARRSRR